MMNIFRILGEFVQLPAHAVGSRRTRPQYLVAMLIYAPGDLSHLFSILILLHKMKTSSVRLLPIPSSRRTT
jgi:hypothetical protein